MAVPSVCLTFHATLSLRRALPRPLAATIFLAIFQSCCRWC